MNVKYRFVFERVKKLTRSQYINGNILIGHDSLFLDVSTNDFKKASEKEFKNKFGVDLYRFPVKISIEIEREKTADTNEEFLKLLDEAGNKAYDKMGMNVIQKELKEDLGWDEMYKFAYDEIVDKNEISTQKICLVN